jgi:ferredoxin
MKQVPVLDISGCTDCEGCLSLCPEVFVRNDAGFIQVVELDSYPQEAVDEAIKNCPCGCISWE